MKVSHPSKVLYRPLLTIVDTEMGKIGDMQQVSHPALGVEPISASQDALIKAILSSQVEYTLPKNLHFRPTIEDLNTCYCPSQLVNDEIINAYLHLLTAKQKKENKIHTFNTFFFTTLECKGYDSVGRWAPEFRGKALLQLDTIFIPVNQNCHWVLIVVHPGTRIIKEFNSLKRNSSVHAHRIKQFLDREVFDETWQVQCAPSPQQSNGYDCGVFLLTSARCIALGLPVNFNQSDIPSMRKRIVAELINNDIDAGKINVFLLEQS